MKKPVQFGFSLIELLVVISIIGLLSTLLVSNYNNVRQRARDAQRIADLRNLQTSLRLYFNDQNTFPANTAGFVIQGCGAAPCGAACAWGASTGWICDGNTYMGTMVKDPQSPDREYRYTRTSATTYTLTACLENSSNERCNGNDANWCPVGTGCIYQVGQ